MSRACETIAPSTFAGRASPTSRRIRSSAWPFEHASIDYRHGRRSRAPRRSRSSPPTGEPYSRYYAFPRTADDLLKRSALIELATAEGGTLVVLIKEIGTDALFGAAARRASAVDAAARHRVPAAASRRSTGTAATNDLAVAVAQTDVKGDRSLGARRPRPIPTSTSASSSGAATASSCAAPRRTPRSARTPTS